MQGLFVEECFSYQKIFQVNLLISCFGDKLS